MRLNRVIKGEKFCYYVNFIPNTMKANVRWFMGDAPIECDITNDFKYIIIPDIFTQWVSGHGQVKIGKIKLPRYAQHEAKDYNSKPSLV